MNRAVASQFRRAGVEPTPDVPAFASRWYGRSALCLATGIFCNAAFPPVSQFYLAWIALVPWLLVLRTCRSQKGAFFWSWLAGFFFSTGFWWLWGVTKIGTPVLFCILGLYWGFTGLILRGAGVFIVTGTTTGGWRDSILKLRSPSLRIAVTAIVWVSITEWLRGSWPWNGLPWLFLGHSQIPFLWICQIADLAGVTGISLLVVAVNAWIATWIGNRLNFGGLVRPAGALVALLIAGIGYGVYRCQTEPASWARGPVVLAVQPNFPQHNDGSKGASLDDLVRFHLDQTKAELAKGQKVDLIAWSETVMPAMDTDALDHNPDQLYRQFGFDVRMVVARAARFEKTPIITGGLFLGDFGRNARGDLIAHNKGNVAYFFDRFGTMDETPQVKIHLVPFGEYVPFRESFPALYNFLLKFGPPDLADYELTPGTELTIHHFTINTPWPPNSNGQSPPPNIAPRTDPQWNFTTPICFEDVDAELCATMVRPLPATPDRKQADFLVNLTNDGWFAGPQNRQHFDIACFRCIENRVPMARAVNTGVSGFIDPLGRGFNELKPRTEGATIGRLPLDPRVTLFTRTGPVVAEMCAVFTALLALVSLVAKIAPRFTPPKSAVAIPATEEK
jgi:apolipoprotein N-acyltransferase